MSPERLGRTALLVFGIVADLWGAYLCGRALGRSEKISDIALEFLPILSINLAAILGNIHIKNNN